MNWNVHMSLNVMMLQLALSRDRVDHSKDVNGRKTFEADDEMR